MRPRRVVGLAFLVTFVLLAGLAAAAEAAKKAFVS